MEGLTNTVTIIVVFAILIQFCVDRIKDITGEKVMKAVPAPIWAVAFGVLYALMFNIDFSAVSYWQARARIQVKDRIKPAIVYWIFAKGGIEAEIYECVQKKQDYTLNHFRKNYLR